MESFIKKIFEGKKDIWTHLQFQKFSKGEFKDRAMIVAKNSKGKYSINTTPEYANELVMLLAEKLGKDKTKVTGVIISTRDLKNEFEFSDLKQFMGIKQYRIDKEMTGEEILEICNKFQKSFISLSFRTQDDELKIKEKSPKSSKPSTKSEESPKIDFCKLKTSDEGLLRKLIFDGEAGGNWKKIEVKHNFIINEIIVSENLRNEKDFAKIREESIRKGKIIREITIDGRNFKKEKEFEA